MYIVPDKRVSIKDIARLADVSHATVSRALSGSPLVQEQTAERIRRIAAEYGYRVSAVARSLATSKTETVGVVVTSISDPFVAGVVEGIENEALAKGYSVLLANSGADAEREIKVVESFEARRVDGIIVTASRVGALHAKRLERMRIPIVLVNNQHPSEFTHSIVIENAAAAQDAVAHLIELGHRRIGYIGDRFGYSSDTERFSGFRAALDAADVPFVPELVQHGNGKAEGGLASMRKLLELPKPPTAVFCYNDLTAMGALKAIRARKLKVPGDISLVGFDGLELTLYLEPALTTVRQPVVDMGRRAMETLFKMMAGEDAAETIRVPGQLLIRQSTGPPKEKSCNYSSVPATGRKRT